MSHWEEAIFPQEKLTSGDGDGGNNSLERFDSADYQNIVFPTHHDCFHIASNPRSVIGEGITSPHRDLSDPTSSPPRGPSGPGSLPESVFQNLRIEYGEHGWHVNPEQGVGHGSHGQGLPPLDPLFASHSSGQGGHRGTLQVTPSTCEWRTTDGSICGEIITRPTVPQHLAKHGIVDLRSDMPIGCLWCPNGSKIIKRKGIVRHVREVHLHLKRQHTSTASGNGLKAYEVPSALDVTEQSDHPGLNTEDHAQGYRDARPPRKRTANGPQTTCTSKRHTVGVEVPDMLRPKARTHPLRRTHKIGAIVGSADSESEFPDIVTTMVYTDERLRDGITGPYQPRVPKRSTNFEDGSKFEVSHGGGRYATSPNVMIASPKIAVGSPELFAEPLFLLPEHCQPLKPLTKHRQQPRLPSVDHLYEDIMLPVTTGLSSTPVSNTPPANPPHFHQECQQRSDQPQQQIRGGYPPHGGYRTPAHYVYQGGESDPIIPPRYAMGDIKGMVPYHYGPGACHEDMQCGDPREMYEASHGWETPLRLARHLELMDSMPVFAPPIDELLTYCEPPDHQHLGGLGPSPGPPSEPHPWSSYPRSSQGPAV
ncbi:hypothetical protein BDN67DRAFT_998928 [Paxillus ammoniavirescens]|nr:hypothetical protein BDN67DRAFT_998928 [Paxillus ammoniavirescens]